MQLSTNKFSKKNKNILGKYIEFCPHSKSLDGVNALTHDELVRLGFTDVNITLANIVEALENAPSKGYSKEDLEKMVAKAVNQGTKEIKQEMITMKDDIVKEAKEYADTVQAQASKNMGI